MGLAGSGRLKVVVVEPDRERWDRGKGRARPPWTRIRLKEKKGSPVRLESKTKNREGKGGSMSDRPNCSDTICHNPDGSDMLGSARTEI